MLAMYFDDRGVRSEVNQGLLTPPPDSSRESSASSEVNATQQDRHTPPADDLEAAVSSGDLAKVRRAFNLEKSHGHPVDRLGVKRTSHLLYSALNHKQASIANYLINQDVPFGTKHVECAVSRGLTSFLDIFLQRGWDINESDPQGLPLLAKVLDNIKLVSWFLQHGANPNKQSSRGVTPLSVAVAQHSLEHVRMLLSYGSVNKGYLLHFAVCRQDAEGLAIAQFLLDSGAKVNEVMCEDDRNLFEAHRNEGLGTPLHYTANTGMVSMVNLLLQHGADPRLRNTLGKSSYDIAREAGHLAVLQVLEKFTPDTQMTAAQRQHISIADLCN